MKFELSTGAGLLVMVTGLAIYNTDHVIFESLLLNISIVYLLPLATSSYLLVFEGWRSSEVLAETRSSLVEKYYRK